MISADQRKLHFIDCEVAPQSLFWNTTLIWGNALGWDAVENELVLESFKPLFNYRYVFRSVCFSPTLLSVSVRGIRAEEKDQGYDAGQVQWMSPFYSHSLRVKSQTQTVWTCMSHAIKVVCDNLNHHNEWGEIVLNYS